MHHGDELRNQNQCRAENGNRSPKPQASELLHEIAIQSPGAATFANPRYIKIRAANDIDSARARGD
jgi:hypothetical protein